MNKFLIFSILVIFLVSSCHSLQCWTCNNKCGCRTPVAEECPATSRCYTLKSFSNGDIVHKGCAVDCVQANQNGKMCESCDDNMCNSEQSLAPMSGYDDCPGKTARSYQSDIGSGTGYNSPFNQNPNNNNNIGSGTGYNPNNIGSGTGYNPGNYPNPRQQQPANIGAGTGYGNSPNGNYDRSANVGNNPYPSYGRNDPHIGQGARPGGYNSASTLDLTKSLGIILSLALVHFL